jgi:hypothetical protein
MVSLLLFSLIFSISFVEHINSKLLILLLVLLVRSIINNKKKSIDYQSILIFSSFFIISILQVFYSDFDQWNKYIIRIIPFFILPLVFSLYSKVSKINIREIGLSSLVFSTSIQSLYLIIIALWRQYQFSSDFSKINWYLFARYDFTDAIGIHPTYLGAFVVFSIIIILDRILKKKSKQLDYLIIVVLIPTLFMTGSRVALVALISSVSIFLFLNRDLLDKKIILYIFVFSTIITVIVFTLIPILYERMISMTFGFVENIEYAKYGNNLSFTGGLTPRFQMWDCCISSISNSSIFGNGIGFDFKLLQQCYLDKGYIDIYNEGFGPHSQYFSSLISGGILKLGVLLLTFIYSLIIGFKRKDYIYISFIIIVMLSCTTESFLDRQKGIVFYTLFNSILFYFPTSKLE